jgi:cytochrome c oxidase subunit II
MRHFVINAILIAIASVLIYGALAMSGLMPLAASAQAEPIDWLFDLQVKFMSFLFALIVVPMGYSLWVFRRRPGETGDGEHIEGNTGLEITWTVIPLIIVIGMGIIGADNLARVKSAEVSPVTVRAVGFQWSWRFEYPEGFSSPELYLPVNRQALLLLESPDVLHSFWVPEFRVKQDLVPGIVTELRVTPTIEGEYMVRCAEMCGVSHAYMESPVIVVSQAEYDAWVAAKVAQAEADAIASAGQPDAGRGQRLYEEQGCRACHSIDGSAGIGPTWKGLFGNPAHPLADGSTVLVDEAYIAESILDPNAKIAAGFGPNAMPMFNLTEGQIADLIEFIKTLK